MRTLDIPLINCEINLTLTWSKNCVIKSKVRRDSDPDAALKLTEIVCPICTKFKITDTKLYVPVVTLSLEDVDNLLQQLKTAFKRTISWNKYKSEMATQAKADILIYLIDSIFSKVNKLFVLSFEKEDDGTPFPKYIIHQGLKYTTSLFYVMGKAFLMFQ